MIKIEIEKDDLVQLLDPFARLANAKSINPILKGVLIEFKDNMVVGVASDDDLSIRNVVIVKNNFLEHIKILIDLKMFQEIIKKMFKGLIILEIKDSTIEVKQKQLRYKIALLNINLFPTIEFEEEFSSSINAHELKSAINQVVHCVAIETSRLSLTGVCIKSKDDYICASDSYRLSMRKNFLTTNLNQDVILSTKLINEIKQFKEGEIFYKIKNNLFYLKYEDIQIAARLIDGKFPDLKKLVPNEIKTNFTINIADTINALEHLTLLKTEGVTVAKMTTKENFLKLETNKSEIGECTEELSITDFLGDSININFNANYLIQALKKLEGFIEIKVKISKNNLIIIEQDDLTQLIVPILDVR